MAITAEKFALQSDRDRLEVALADLTQQVQQLQSDAKLTESLNEKEKQERRALEAELWSQAQQLKGTERTQQQQQQQQREALLQQAVQERKMLQAELERAHFEQIGTLQQEYQTSIDKLSQKLIVGTETYVQQLMAKDEIIFQQSQI